MRSRGTAAKARASGRFVLRLDPGLHASLRSAARDAGTSLNDYCARKLAAPAGVVVLDGARAVVERAMAVLGDALLGVVAHGSWARGEAADGSDVDVLVVADTSVEITRALYRRWDEAPVAWEGREVEPHFVRLPDPDAPPSGLWAEAAMEGIVLFERALVVSSCLVRVRRQILAGRLVRRQAHGQPYWTREE